MGTARGWFTIGLADTRVTVEHERPRYYSVMSLSAAKMADVLRGQLFDVVHTTGRTGGGKIKEVDVRYLGPNQWPVHDLNNVVIPNAAYAYVERGGRIWLLADGPKKDQSVAVVYIAALNAADSTSNQTGVLAALLAALDVKLKKPKKRPVRDKEVPVWQAQTVAPDDVTLRQEPVRGSILTFTVPVGADEFKVEHNVIGKSGWDTTLDWTACEPGELLWQPVSFPESSEVTVRLSLRDVPGAVVAAPLMKHSTD